VKLSPSALERYLWDPRLGELPCLREQLFSRHAPLQVEIGFGGGEYLDWWAGEQPQNDFLGIELPPDCLYRAAAQLERSQRDNVRLVQGDARYLLSALFAPASLHHVLMQFPMPWPKEKHAKHRVSSPGFAATLATVLEPGGQFELVTDQDWYAAECHQHFRANQAFSVLSLEQDPPRPFRTRYERKWLQEGRAIHRLLVRLERPHPQPCRLNLQAMEHLQLEQAPSSEVVDSLVGRSWKQEDLSASVKACFRAPNGWLLRVVAADDSFSQMFHLRVRQREDQRWLLQVDGLPRPYYTAAVRFLQRQVAEALGKA